LFSRSTQLFVAMADTIGMAIQLRKDQRAVLAWAQRTLVREGGVLFADAPGFGKSYQALGVAQFLGLRPIIVAPRTLVPMWEELLGEFALDGMVLSYGEVKRWHESGRADAFSLSTAIWIVDEAHAFVNPRTQRYRALARAIAGFPVILLSATPFQNRAEDGLHLLALFSGEARWLLHRPTCKEDGLRLLMSRVGIARARPVERAIDYHHFQVRAEREEITRAASALCMQEEPRALMLHWLLSRRLSSYSAWYASIRRAAHYLLELEDAAAHGRTLNRDIFGRDLVHGQRVFPFMLLDDTGTTVDSARIRVALSTLRSTAKAVRAQRHPRPWRWVTALERPVVVFSQYRATIDEAFQHLRSRVRVIRWTGAGIDSNFPRTSRRITTQLTNAVLLATDVGAQGVDLRTARTLVHADLHWNPMRTVQREGRIQRGTKERRATIWTPQYPDHLNDLWALHARRAYKETLVHRFSPTVWDDHEDVESGDLATTRQLEQYLSAVLRALRDAKMRGLAPVKTKDLQAWSHVLEAAQVLSVGASSWIRLLNAGETGTRERAAQRLGSMLDRLVRLLNETAHTTALR